MLLLRSLAADPSFVIAVHSLFMKCAADRKIPDDWKMANVVALHKKGALNKAENFRPVSLVFLVKCTESLLESTSLIMPGVVLHVISMALLAADHVLPTCWKHLILLSI